MKFLLSSLLLFLAAVAQAASSTGSRLLSIWEDVEDQKLYSKFIGDLEKRGYKISHATPKQEDLKLDHLGQRTYDHVLIFPTKAKGLGPNLTAKLLLDFLDAGGNIMLALSATQPVPTALNALLLELDIQIPAERTGLVVDHFNYDADSAADLHDVVLVPTPDSYRPGTKNYFGSGGKADLLAVPRAVGHTLGNGALLAPILKAPRTAYLYNPKEQAEVVDDVFAAGAQLSLVSAFQALNSARFTVVSSAEMFQDKWFDAKVKRPSDKEAVKAWNEQFARRLTGWTFQEIGHLRVNYVEHHLAEEGPLANISNPELYRINNNVTYEISISEWVWDKWFAFKVPEGDELQLEFSMLSPLHRLQLKNVKSASTETEGVYRVTFTVPDQHGVFNFLTNYKRPFLSNIEEKRAVTVRHMAHDEYPFSYEISAAWPYLSSIGVTSLGWLVFVAIWMFNKPVRQAGEAKKKQ
ncbi:Dolichyl-diphosphooligosaccharide--protein glycosyltransferase subunit wbp1 [Cytospora mali]|uniref:Dolichyl-diphosphooligosaccharide--protein glycosyltransferase subunit WBP1 n=1 Tax=Cytospora mali TaxID=578113 RepID=A0A194UR93_CYTMA|nr:Dolichyl-diphosphooligosaccharide--protein glycosyltransferase subunit wbp1 [Valsa mali var. pyri (nom. inval.)]